MLKVTCQRCRRSVNEYACEDITTWDGKILVCGVCAQEDRARGRFRTLFLIFSGVGAVLTALGCLVLWLLVALKQP